MSVIQTILVIFCITFTSESARILGWFPGPSHSHQVVYVSIMTELVKRGHEVVVIRPNTVESVSGPNYHQIFTPKPQGFFADFNFTSHRDSVFHCEKMMHIFFDRALILIENQFEHPSVQQLIAPDSTEKFDLIFIEWLYFPALYPLGLKFNAPIIGITSLPMMIPGYDTVGSPANPAFGDTYLPYSPPLTFFERLHSLMHHLYTRFLWYLLELPKHDKLARKYFGDWIPYVGDLQTNVSLVFMTSNPVFHGPRPHVPAVVEVSRLHVLEPKPLPKDIKHFLDRAKKGIIYFSMGGNVKSKDFSPHVCQLFLNVFSELQDYMILWKWETENIPENHPLNVKFVKWCPQSDVIAHSKIRAFIMQGGLQSLEEAMEYGVPVLAIPFISDQGYNAKRIEDLGIGIKLEHHDLSKQSISEALHQLLNNDSYRRNMEHVSKLVKDQSMTSMERVMWWTEYVLRHKGARHLRSAAVDLPWYQLLLLDVIGFVLLILLGPVYIFYYIISTIRSRQKQFKNAKKKVE